MKDGIPKRTKENVREIRHDQEQAESLLRSLANQFGRDPAATDVSRVLRLPRFHEQEVQRTVCCSRSSRDRSGLPP